MDARGASTRVKEERSTAHGHSICTPLYVMKGVYNKANKIGGHERQDILGVVQ
jgi:hypothetical protein